jgi:putative ABC transport system substrate-binding protein
LQQESRTIPIVFAIVSDPVGDGFVASLARPGGNITGFTNVEASLGGKWLEIIKEIAPDTRRIAIVYGPKTSASGGQYYEQLINAAAKSEAIEAVATPVGAASEIESSLATFATLPHGALIVTPDATTTSYRQAIFAAAAAHRLPAIYSFSAFAREGGLVSYGVDITEVFRQAASYADRILRGAIPADLPVQAPTKFELVVNAKVAKALGLSVPPTLLARADEVIE